MTQAKPRILVIGSTGFLGAALTAQLESAVGANRDLVDLSKPVPSSALDTIQAGGFQFVLICAAVTDVEKCFRERELSNRVNVTGTIELLNIIRQAGATPIFFSSDYVFANQPGPHREDALRAPETVYGKQKLAVEKYLEENFERYLIFRTSKLISKANHPRNILTQVFYSLRESKPIRAFEDQWLNPVFIEDIAKAVEASCRQGLNGSFHLGTRRIFARDEMTRLLAKAAGYNPAFVQPIKISNIPFSETRPNHNTLDCGKIENALGFRFTELEDALDELLSNHR